MREAAAGGGGRAPFARARLRRSRPSGPGCHRLRRSRCRGCRGAPPACLTGRGCPSWRWTWSAWCWVGLRPWGTRAWPRGSGGEEPPLPLASPHAQPPARGSPCLPLASACGRFSSSLFLLLLLLLTPPPHFSAALGPAPGLQLLPGAPHSPSQPRGVAARLRAVPHTRRCSPQAAPGPRLSVLVISLFSISPS